MNSAENSTVISALAQTIETLNQNVKELKETIEDLNANYSTLKNDYALLQEENAYLKRKLFWTKSEKMSYVSPEQLSFFDEAETLADEDAMEAMYLSIEN